MPQPVIVRQENDSFEEVVRTLLKNHISGVPRSAWRVFNGEVR
jgi:hypothetical protein